MKFKKKTVLLLCFVLGSLLTASTALADIANKDGYEQLKDGFKVTADQLSTKLNSYTLETSVALKDNGTVLDSEDSVTKYSVTQGAKENTSASQGVNTTDNHNYYSYSDKTMDIYHNDADPTYRVVEYTSERKSPASFNNPFQEERASDVERIIDALVGGLRDHVVVQTNADGSKELSGSLSEVQIPALVNAVVSFEVKQEFNGNQDNIPNLTQDVFVKQISGSASINKDGIMERILGTAVLSGKDKQGAQHELTVEILTTLKDINTTTVVKPDLNGKKVEKQTAQTNPGEPGLANPQKFIGSYKNDIIIEKDGKYVKIGERHLEITAIDQNQVTGNYREEYKQGFEDYAAMKSPFTFTAQFGQGPNKNSRNSADFQSTSGQSGLSGVINFDEYGAKINFYINNYNTRALGGFDGMFNPVLD
jgi:hypothetical protein